MSGKNGTAERLHEGTMTNLSREDELLVHCARLDLSRKRCEAVKDILVEGIDWDLLIKKAAWHRLSPLLAHHLMSPDLSALIPMAILKKIRGTYYQSLARSIILQNELYRLLSAFNNQEIPVIVLKGAALLESIYRDISLRPMGDLDILVRPERLDQAEAIAFKLGYGFRANRELQEQTRQSCHHLANLWHHEKNIMLEIHHHIVSHDEPYYFNLEDFWARARSDTILGAHALTLAPEDLLIHLSIKFLLDRRYQSNAALGQLCDISEVIKHYDDSLDWDLIEKTSRENGVLKGLHFVLHACEHLLSTPVPTVILSKFQPQGFNPTSAEQFIRRRVLDTRPWLAHGLLDSRQTFSRRRMARAIAGRFSHFSRQIIGKNGNGNKGLSGWGRIGDILPRLGRVLIRPAELKEDLRLDHWLHDLYKSD
jgi:hypothetical protein